MRVPALFSRACMSVALTVCVLSPSSGFAQVSAAAPAAPPVAPAVGVPVAPAAAAPDNILNLDLSTGGRVTIQLYPEIAPAHVDRIKTLVRQGFTMTLFFTA